MRDSYPGLHAVMFRRAVLEAVGGSDASCLLLRTTTSTYALLASLRSVVTIGGRPVPPAYCDHASQSARMLQYTLGVIRSQQERVKGTKRGRRSYNVVSALAEFVW